MIFFVSRYLYFLLLLAFLLVVCISRAFPGEVLGNNMVLIFTVLLLPLVDICIENIKSESKKFDWTLSGAGLLKIIFTGIIMFIAHRKGAEPLALATLAYFVLGLLFRFHSRIAFFVSLFCFAYVALYLLIDNKEMAEGISIYAYYYLVIGVIHQLYQARHEKKNISTSLEQ